MAPVISVVITCYNLERYIGPAIESVLAQDISEPFEVIVVDDCSEDGSAAIIKSYSNVRYIRTDSNSGVLIAMLDGIKRTSGELIFLLDGDDLWEPDKLARSVEAFRSDPNCALTSHDLLFVDEANRQLARTSRPEQVLSRLKPDERSSRMAEGILHHLDFVWLGSALGVHRRLADLQGFDSWARRLPDPANTYQDWPLAFWAASLPGTTMAYVPQKLFRYRLHSANHSGDARDARRAIRNLTRAKNTLEATLDIAMRGRLPAKVCKGLRSRALSYKYLIDLYSKRQPAALIGFIRALPDFLRRGEAAKETLRLAAIMLLGPDRFAELRAGSGRPNRLGDPE